MHRDTRKGLYVFISICNINRKKIKFNLFQTIFISIFRHHVPVAFYILFHLNNLFIVVNSSVNFIIYCCVAKPFRMRVLRLLRLKGCVKRRGLWHVTIKGNCLRIKSNFHKWIISIEKLPNSFGYKNVWIHDKSF